MLDTVAGGAVLPDGVSSSDTDAQRKMVGSYYIFQADTADQVWDSLKRDSFYASGEVVSARATTSEGVDDLNIPDICIQWDHSRITITPVLPAFPRVE